MADPLYELLIPYLDQHDATQRVSRLVSDDTIAKSYLERLTTLPLAALTTSEQQSLSQSSQSILRNLQSLSKRSHKPIISSTDHLSSLSSILPKLGYNAAEIYSSLPALETSASQFSTKYSRSGENEILERRRKAMLLARNIDRVSDILDLPTLLSSAISSSTSTVSQPTSSSTTTNANYASALDLHAYIKRLHTLYPNSSLIDNLSRQAEREMRAMTTNLISSLQSPGIKLAGAMRTIGWLRRVAPELDDKKNARIGSGEGTLGALFLVCRLGCLVGMLEALDPLRDLAEQETSRRLSGCGGGKAGGWQGGQQTERYLKRYIEIFREQSFAIISMYKSIFPSALPAPGSVPDSEETAPEVKAVEEGQGNPLQPTPSALATFPLHLVDLLFETLQIYVPNVQDRSSRDSLLTQVLYCAGSLGRLGGDFSMMIAILEEDLREEIENDGQASGFEKRGREDGDVEVKELEEEWVEVMKKHRVQASRLELLASGVGTGRTTSPDVKTVSPSH
ncbi:Dor1-domain-containing protein [Zopfia rhizophila CBS 207.26]|uniref:Conserved oligomeric Golgi complex subunit 8 n=1 Tax=Zopfia rhizophila CBS 207.26 TaxID=1314779 RepID=A0A6A6D624_9PEZI|nr:Dor1-domain-containing protein [Zopfia rhizophila CBS 207.26]